jgi:hypothetical protein
MNRNHDLWIPEIRQEGAHMIMQNIKKESKIKYVNVDSRFQNEYNQNKLANFTYELPQKITDVKSIAVRTVEIPMTFFYFSQNRGNTFFKANNTSVQISDGNNTVISLRDKILNTLQNDYGNYDITFDINSTNNIIIQNDSVTNYTISWDVDASGGFQKNNLKASLGWCLGFRQPSYTIPVGTNIISEGVVDIYNIRYLFLVVDEFRSSNPNSFLSPQSSSLLSKNILARITLNPAFFPYGSILTANTFNGYLLSDQRVYSGKTDIQKLKIQLVDELGIPVDLNQVDFSFCLEIEFE